jgi:hypothetical protein
MRKNCSKCGDRPVAVNYHKEGKTYYRSVCDHCARGYNSGHSLWQRSGYKKKPHCDKCGFKSNHTEIFEVIFVDDNPNNIRPNNLKTVCANCRQILAKEGRWKQGDLRPDF